MFAPIGLTYNNNVFNLTNTQIVMQFLVVSACPTTGDSIAYFKSYNCKFTTPTNSIFSTTSAIYYFGHGDLVIDNNTFDSVYWLPQRTRPFIYIQNNPTCDPTWRTSQINITNNKFSNLSPTNNI